MKECREFESLIDRAQTGEATEVERETLLEHMESCRRCSEVFEAVGRLRDADLHPEPPAEDLLSMRRAVLRQIRGGRRPAPKAFSLAFLWSRPIPAAALAIAALALGFLLGGGAGRFVRSDREPQTAFSADRFASSIKSVARSHTDYEDIVNSPFTYTNVRVSQERAGMVHLSFDVSRHLDLSLRKEDPLVTEILVQSLIEPSGVDTRLTAISMAENVAGPKIKKSLIQAMLYDENLAVRMTAQSKLVERRADSEVAESLLTVLEQEPSVRMRLVAIDYLTSSNVRPERLERAVQAGRPENREAVLVKASQYLNR